jgi:hypothetical protein
MHYIRLLRPPALEGPSHRPLLKLVVTITTDLGDAFLSPDQPISLSVLVGTSTGQDHANGPSFTNIAAHRPPKWMAGMRVLKLELPIPPGIPGPIQVRPSDQRLVASTAGIILAASSGQIFPVCVEVPIPGVEAQHVSFRRLRLEENITASFVEFDEEIGESIARHVWDAGILTVCLLAQLLLGTRDTSGRSALPKLKQSLAEDRELNILELGCGVGILGIGIAKLLQSVSPERLAASHVLMTDLTDAEERAEANISRHTTSLLSSPVHLQYENLDWEDGKLGNFGPKVQTRPWNLIVLSDCTYNVDVIPTLVQTLSQLHRQTEMRDTGLHTKVLLATKRRHPSEEALYDLMATDGWHIEEQVVCPLPVLDADDQSVEIYVFEKR